MSRARAALLRTPLALAALLLAGVALRALAMATYRPAALVHFDSVAYLDAARTGLFDDPIHPAGYAAFLRVATAVGDRLWPAIALQHLLGIAGALVLYAAVRRAGGGVAAGTAAAAVPLLAGDVLFLEHALMSEAVFVPLVAALAYAVVRALDAPPAPRERLLWLVAVGALIGAAALVRSVGLALLPALALLVAVVLPAWRAGSVGQTAASGGGVAAPEAAPGAAAPASPPAAPASPPAAPASPPAAPASPPAAPASPPAAPASPPAAPASLPAAPASPPAAPASPPAAAASRADAAGAPPDAAVSAPRGRGRSRVRRGAAALAPRLASAAALTVAAAVVLGGYLAVQSALSDRPGFTEVGGWALYGRAAPFADCDEFDPPAGTGALCERTPPDARPGGDFYAWVGGPARAAFGAPPRRNDDVGAFARAAIRAQPLDYVEAVATDLARYVDPDAGRARPYSGDPPELVGFERREPDAERASERALARHYAPAEVERTAALGALEAWGRVVRLHGLLLLAALVLAVTGAAAGRGRARVPALALAIVAATLLAAPALTGFYNARYAVPAAGPLAAAAVLGATALAARRSAPSSAARSATTAPGSSLS